MGADLSRLAMQKRILLLALTGWDCTYKDKTLAELDSQGVLAERDWLLAELDEVQAKIDELIREKATQGGEKDGGNKDAGD